MLLPSIYRNDWNSEPIATRIKFDIFHIYRRCSKCLKLYINCDMLIIQYNFNIILDIEIFKKY